MYKNRSNWTWCQVMLIHRLWNNVYHRWITNNFACKWHRTASTASGCKSSPRKIFHWNSSGDNREGKKTSLSTAKATSSTKRPQTCTEAATKYYNYTVNETDEEREHRLPTLPKATRLDQATLKVYCQNYLLRCSDRQPRGGGELLIWKGWGCSSEILNSTPKRDRSGRSPSFFWP